MSELTYTVPTLSSAEEVEKAIQRYKTSDLSGAELLSQWQAIRDASLNQNFAENDSEKVTTYDSDKVPGQDSY
ncbi:MAG TPA: hypothetical protein V6D28_02225 [Leptolyngbyaceae cyanobacterium]